MFDVPTGPDTPPSNPFPPVPVGASFPSLLRASIAWIVGQHDTPAPWLAYTGRLTPGQVDFGVGASMLVSGGLMLLAWGVA